MNILRKQNENLNRVTYGKYNGHYKWDLAKAWLTMSNDSFFNRFGFNWIPPVYLYKEARKYL